MIGGASGDSKKKNRTRQKAGFLAKPAALPPSASLRRIPLRFHVEAACVLVLVVVLDSLLSRTRTTTRTITARKHGGSAHYRTWPW
jgi:hypothetical protein